MVAPHAARGLFVLPAGTRVGVEQAIHFVGGSEGVRVAVVASAVREVRRIVYEGVARVKDIHIHEIERVVPLMGKDQVQLCRKRVRRAEAARVLQLVSQVAEREALAAELGAE